MLTKSSLMERKVLHRHQGKHWGLTLHFWNSKSRLYALPRLSFQCNSYLHQPWQRCCPRSAPCMGSLSPQADNVNSLQHMAFKFCWVTFTGSYFPFPFPTWSACAGRVGCELREESLSVPFGPLP